MPAALVQSFASKTGKSISEVEKLWKEIKEDLKKRYSTTDPKFYGTLVLILKRKLGIKDASAFLLTKKLHDFTSKVQFNVDEIDKTVRTKLSAILKKSEVKLAFFAEYQFKGVDAVVVVDVKGGVEFWVMRKNSDYVKRGTFTTLDQLVKMVKKEDKILTKFAGTKNENDLTNNKYELTDSKTIYISDIVTSEFAGPFVNCEPGPWGTPIQTLRQKFVCTNKKCGFVMPKTSFLKKYHGLKCPSCGSPMK